MVSNVDKGFSVHYWRLRTQTIKDMRRRHRVWMKVIEARSFIRSTFLRRLSLTQDMIDLFRPLTRPEPGILTYCILCWTCTRQLMWEFKSFCTLPGEFIGELTVISMSDPGPVYLSVWSISHNIGPIPRQVLSIDACSTCIGLLVVLGTVRTWRQQKWILFT